MKRSPATRIARAFLLGIAPLLSIEIALGAEDRPICAGVKISPQWDSVVSAETPLLFAEGLRIRRAPKSRVEKFESEFALALGLLKSNIVRPGFQALSLSLPQAFELQTPAVNEALKCLIDAHRLYPTLQLPEALLGNLDQFPETRERRRLAILAVLKMIRKRAPHATIEKFSKLAPETTAEGKFAKGLYLAHLKKTKGAFEAFDGYFKLQAKDDFLARYDDHAHLIAARSAYAIGDYPSAIRHYQAVSKSSNHLAEALSELSWAFLRAEKYPESIGTAIQLQSGGLKRAYAPEAPMVMAMALNEVCQFPESIKAVKIFQTQHKSTYEWLKANSRQNVDLFYPMILAYIKRTGTVPDKVAGEWVRTPEFISRQQEINLFSKERSYVERFEALAKFISNRLGLELLKQASDLRKRVKKAQSLDALMSDLDRLRQNIDRYVALKRSAPFFRGLAKVNVSKEAGRKKVLLGEMNRYARVRSQEMLVQLNELAENIQLIEAELYSGAAKDLVWQNAQPDVKERAKDFMEQQKANRPADAWYWGHAEHGLEGSEEVWEDELGSFKVDIVDYCEMRDAQRGASRGEKK